LVSLAIHPPQAVRKDPGVEKLSFFTPQVFNGQITAAVKGADWCDVGWLPKWP
jgi:hypothetical protein